MVIYFGEIANGMISTISNPSLTHGLSKLKAMLKKLSEDEADEGEISVIVNNTDKPIELKIIVEHNEELFRVYKCCPEQDRLYSKYLQYHF